MARNDDPTFDADSTPEPADRPDPTTAEYPEITEPAEPRDSSEAKTAPVGAGGHTTTAPVILRTGGGVMRGLFWAVAAVGLVFALLLGARTVGLLPELKNPFAKEQTDRSGPVLLKSVQDLSQFVAAEGNFEVIVDVKQDRKYTPDFLVNRRILFVASGSVEVYVDFASIGQGAVKESPDRRTAEIALPAPQLRPVRINNDRSYVYEEQRGVLNKLAELFKSDPNRLQEVYKLAELKIGEAAKDAGLETRAQENTRKMLQQFLAALGYTSVTVTFAAP